MACFHPISGYRAEAVNPGSGKRSIVFDRRKAAGGGLFPVEIPCGQCIGCRLERSRQWAVRCVHEASLYDSNSFVTLTYDAAHLPAGGTLVKKDFQDFMKRLRERVGSKIRYFHCGEYGEALGRPHYHAILFNFDFSDKVLWRTSSDAKLYTSDFLSDVWSNGHCTVGGVSFDSAAYVARYCVKKITGSAAVSHYGGKLPEYTTMSRRPGIGRGWYDRFSADCYPSDTCVVRGREVKVPKYYDRRFEIDSADLFASVKSRRRVVALDLKDCHENSYERRLVREKVQELNLEQQMQRGFENGKA